MEMEQEEETALAALQQEPETVLQQDHSLLTGFFRDRVHLFARNVATIIYNLVGETVFEPGTSSRVSLLERDEI